MDCAEADAQAAEGERRDPARQAWSAGVADNAAVGWRAVAPHKARPKAQRRLEGGPPVHLPRPCGAPRTVLEPRQAVLAGCLAALGGDTPGERADDVRPADGDCPNRTDG